MDTPVRAARERESCRGHGGFTLLEMMITVLLASLVFFVALPAYQQILYKSYRTAGRGALQDILARQEQYLINYKRYAPDLASLGLPDHYFIDAQSRSVPAARGLYKIELVFEEDQFAGARAVPRNRQRLDYHCLTLSLGRRGERGASGSLVDTPHRCWR